MLASGLLILAACSAERPAASHSETGEAAASWGGDSFRLEREGLEALEVRLAEVRVPDAPEARARAEARLRELLDTQAQHAVELIYTGASTDRYGRSIAHVEFDGPQGRVWVQGVLVSEGLLAVASYADNRARTSALMALESEAREAGRGAWATGALRIREPEPNLLAQLLDSVQIVEGRVVATARSRTGRVYLNFGLDWRTDFTVSIPRSALTAFDAAGLDPASLEGAQIRVRGWLFEENGPMISVDHPEAIEILEAPEPARLTPLRTGPTRPG